MSFTAWSMALKPCSHSCYKHNEKQTISRSFRCKQFLQTIRIPHVQRHLSSISVPNLLLLFISQNNFGKLLTFVPLFVPASTELFWPQPIIMNLLDTKTNKQTNKQQIFTEKYLISISLEQHSIHCCSQSQVLVISTRK